MQPPTNHGAFKSLFCLANGSISGANNVLYGIIQRLEERNQDAKAFCPFSEVQGAPERVSFLEGETFADIPDADYDFVFLSKPFMVPLALPRIRSSKVAFIALDHEDFDNPAVKAALCLPVSIITTSKNVQRSIKDKCGRDSYYVPLALDHSVFRPLLCSTTYERKRVLMVGDYLIPLKGMMTGLKALQELGDQLKVQLVLITQQKEKREIFDAFDFPVEIHCQPSQQEIPKIYASCDAYVCASWYENFPLPPLEAFSCGIPVVSTRNFGISDYGVDGVNLLLTETNDSDDLCQKLKIVLTDSGLAENLVANGLKTAQQYGWRHTVDSFVSCQERIAAEIPAPTVTEADMEPILLDLELQGHYTPSSVRKHCRQLFNLLRDQCKCLLEDYPDHDLILNELKGVKDNLKSYLLNTSTQYYRSVKRRYDLCQLLIGLNDDKTALRLVAMQEAKR